MDLSDEQILRYSRHIILSQIGGNGQKKLLSSSVLCIGAGGLGSPASYYLAACGVGTIGIVDSDEVDLSNLHRQILHFSDDVGRPKTASAEEKLTRLNPGCCVVKYQQRINESNARNIIRNYDIVVDGSDNFETRYIINDACFYERKILVSGAIFQFEGQLTTFKNDPGKPCLRCLYPEAPPPGMFPSCQEAGILGAVGGIIGSMQSVETIKELLGLGESLCGRLLIFDALRMSFREMEVKKLTVCTLCGINKDRQDLSFVSDGKIKCHG